MKTILILDHIHGLRNNFSITDRDTGCLWNLLHFLSVLQSSAAAQQGGTFHTQIHSNVHSVDGQTLWEQLLASVWVNLWNIWAQNTLCQNAHCTGKSSGWRPSGCGYVALVSPICEIPKGPWEIWIVSHHLLLFCHSRRPHRGEACRSASIPEPDCPGGNQFRSSAFEMFCKICKWQPLVWLQVENSCLSMP